MSERIISPLGSENHFVKKSLWFTILDGNILSKTDVGDYSYDAAMRPHAVIGVTNQKGIIPSAALETTYGDLNKINMISDGTHTTTFDYGPDQERWLTVEKKNDTDYRTIHYAPGIERVTLGGVTRTFFYLGHGVIVMQQGSTYIPLLTVTDHQGTIAGLVDATGTWQFDANYDAWGRQTVAKNSIGFQRGYTGHEMLPEYGLINNVATFKSETSDLKRILSPYEKGQVDVNRAIEEFRESGGVVLQREVTVEVDGVRNRFDFVGRKGDMIYLYEVKNGPKAGPTPNQLKNILKLMQGVKFIPIGANAAKIQESYNYELLRIPYTGKYSVVYLHYY